MIDMRTSITLRFFKAAWLPLAVLAIAGCWSGSASMRIDVEVYNGPLAKTKEAQLAELKSSLLHTKRALDVVRDGLEISECRLGCLGDTDMSCQKAGRNIWFEARTMRQWQYAQEDKQPRNWLERLLLPKYVIVETEPKIKTRKQDTLIQVCPMIVELKKDAKSLSNEFGSKCAGFKKTNYLTCASELGHRLRSTAEFWATKHIGILSDSRRARIGLVELTNVAAELGNEVAGRADALLKQTTRDNGPEAITREQLPTSTYLQDSGATDYLNLVTWFDAAVDRPGSTKLDRVRMIERLVTDTHWSRINTVFAAGQGDVRMVFIKDDIGNWNLKSFSNDPTDLVNAYKKVGFAALSTAAGLASRRGSPSELQNVMQFANDVALGSGGNPQGLLSIKALHDSTARRLEDLIARHEQRAEALGARINALDAEVPGLEQDHQALESGLRALVTDRNQLAHDRKDKEADQETVRQEIARLEEQRDADGTSGDDRKAIEQQIAVQHAKANQLEAEVARLDQSMEEKDEDITAEKVKLRRSSHVLVGKQNELAAVLEEQKRLGADTRAEAHTILVGHEDLIDQLQSSVVESSHPHSAQPIPAGSGSDAGGPRAGNP